MLTPINPEDLPNDHILRVCRVGQGIAQCAFYHQSRLGFAKCEKRDPYLKLAVKARLKRNDETLVGTGDNCTGPDSFIPRSASPSPDSKP